MATKAQTSPYAPGQDPAAIEANRAYQDALAKLTQSLDQRKNRFFEPTLLAAAQGFLQPGTSNFFDSLGNVAGNIAKSQEAQIAEDQAIAQQRLELAGRGVELQRQKGKDAMVQQYLNRKKDPPASEAEGDKPTQTGALPSTAQADAAVSSAPQGGLSQAAPKKLGVPEEPKYGVRFAPAEQDPISEEQYIALAISGGMDPAEAVKNWESIKNARTQVKDTGVYDLSKRIFYPAGYKTVNVQIYGYPGQTFEISETDAFRLSNFRRAGDREGYVALAKSLVNPFGEASGATPTGGASAGTTPAVTAPINAARVAPPAAVAPGAAPSAPAAPVGLAGQAAAPADVPKQVVAPVRPDPAAAATGAASVAQPAAAKPPAATPAAAPGILSKEDLAAKVAREQEIQKADTQAEVEKRKTFVQRADEAPDTITTATMLRDFAKDPDAGKMTGILSNSKVSSQIATLLKEGIGTNDLRVAVPGLETAMRNAGLNPAQQAKFRVFLQTVEQMRLQMSKYAKGAVSDFEQRLFSAASVSTEDTPDAVRMKADLLTRRAQFDRRAYREWKKSKLTADEFKESDDYLKMRVEYDKQLSAIALGAKMFQSGTAKTGPAAQAGTPQSAANQAALERIQKELAKGRSKP
jgi:hypothetical protein